MKSSLLLSLILLLTTVVFAQNRYDVVIDEIMADPSPSIGLPGNEWVELKNTSSLPINLQGWRIGDSNGQSGPIPNFLLQPDSIVIICTGSAVAAMSTFGNTISVTSFPSLDNDGEEVVLKSSDGTIIHAVSYKAGWYQNELKKQGGWTLEMIDPHNPCSGISNWKASINTQGGTPGTINSVDAVNNDQQSPELINAFVKDNSTIILSFNEPIDSLSGISLANYGMDGGLALSSAEVLSPSFYQVMLKTINPIEQDKVYVATVNSITDCKGNTISVKNTAKFGLPVDAIAGDIIVNEILFNPRSTGYDYVELYNKSNKIVDAAKLYVSNRNNSGGINSITQLSISPFYLFPGDYIVITEDADNLALNYLVQNPDAVLGVSSLPSFPDDEGFVVVLNQQGEVIDEVNYSADWHFKLIDNAEGISLERVDADGASQYADNWHSAASTAGFGTPGYKNSQFKNQQAISATIQVTPKVFSPDNDGFDDIASIHYKISEPGYVANITIFDAAGRPVRNLVRNGTMAITGYWNWDGLNDKGLKLPIGTYILFTEIFNLRGKKERFKNTVVLVRKLN
ncbi:lamin tail domain-containing protein [Terrimonas pollutisoli]|uniref:lamin tail domain-containing protein n=1 Tax=Terrimonas pollutisoli TaxID=3034147 RepID=UPI0023EDD30C|nr:lamin tail domain-containing protein [Terrimonas sp. H1YJ31]